LTLATIEDVTGGLVADAITSTEQSRHYCHGGLVATGDRAMISWGVPIETIDKYGTVSAETAEAMARAVRERFFADIGVSVTGITGANDPHGLPQGTVFIGIADGHGTKTWQQQYQPGRADTRERAAIAALFRLRERLIELGLGN
jgi:nicotinamide-nucleotide amidase